MFSLAFYFLASLLTGSFLAGRAVEPLSCEQTSPTDGCCAFGQVEKLSNFSFQHTHTRALGGNKTFDIKHLIPGRSLIFDEITTNGEAQSFGAKQQPLPSPRGG